MRREVNCRVWNLPAKRADGQKDNLIVFSAVDEEKEKTKEALGHKSVRLVGGEVSRTPGTSRSSASEGGGGGGANCRLIKQHYNPLNWTRQLLQRV
ncbi:hypothetical protein PDIP_47200 [Penicillium digitatum Pd1]|uniref:Uncharacterized protein n=1 Tax=Penicillium digitatum (strain Pd1 / CECT 20795) TaxID=1170230 RepID=K9FYU4_PEND1|nr:hypothetical protein PDIP_47200 [Penicillium digitatum Pd1]EKV13767.1 hypothetical protein PDIP_47200 [Penicillium digitatum Pd1]